MPGTISSRADAIRNGVNQLGRPSCPILRTALAHNHTYVANRSPSGV